MARKQLADFKESGKYIIAYGEHYTQGTYYICSVADKVILNPQGQVNWYGMASQPIFYKELLEKIGVHMQVFKVGSYKSAVEPFTATQMSEANREQITSYLNDIWHTMLADVSNSRYIPARRLDAYADSMLMLCPAEELVQKRMVDTLCYIDGVSRILREKTGTKEGELPLVNTKTMIAATEDAPEKGDKIAVYYAYGDIVDQQAGWPEYVIDAKSMCRDLKELREDKDVKAVVLRINSGGGSAYASEQIWHEVKLLREKKPVVVSMGGMAASGAYYISAPANWIVAEPTTLTGSIGIFGLFPDASELLTQKLGIKFDHVKTNAHSDFGTSSRPFTAEEMGYLEQYIDRGYKLFRKRVADGRKMSVEEVEKIAQGHVWLGTDAKRIKLVDQLGGLDDAVAKAAELAKTKSYYTKSYPAKASWLDQLLDETVSRNNNLDEQLKETLGAYYEPFMLLRQVEHMDAIQARIPFEPNIK